MTTGPFGETGVDAVEAAGLDVAGPDLGDQSLGKIAEEAKARGSMLRLRLSLQLWNWGQYISWRGQSWRVEVKDREEALLVAESVNLTFDLLARVGAEAAVAWLKGGNSWALGATWTGQRLPGGKDFQDAAVPIRAMVGDQLREFATVEALNAALVEDQKEQERQLAREGEEPPR